MPTITLNPDGSLPTKQILEELYRRTEEYSIEKYPQKHREHLGASVIGEKCRRKLYYGFRWVKLGTPEGRMRRLWQRGKDEEEKIDDLLTWMGFFVREIDPYTDKQYKFSEINGHFGGSGDGIALFPWFRDNLNSSNLENHIDPNAPRILVEKKTFGIKYFGPLKAKGMKETQPKYWAQQCSYGKAFKLKYGLFIAVCKDNDEIYYELNELDWQFGEELQNKAKDIINSEYLPEKISNDPNYYECKFCIFCDNCHWGEAVEINCRSCKYSKPVENANWYCSKFNSQIPLDFIAKGCPEHLSVNE